MNSESAITDILPSSDPAESLVQVFLRHSGHLSDKWEQYLGVYELELGRFAHGNRPVQLLEIGVQNGGSLQIWRDYLPPGSDIVGVDVDAECANLQLGGGISVFVANGANSDELAAVLGDRTFDVVIDDGSHRSDDIVDTIRLCFDRVTPGGVYLIEDLHCSYLSAFNGGYRKPGAAIEWLKGVADALNSDHFAAAAKAEMDQNLLRELQEIGAKTARISFYDSMAVLEKLPVKKRAPYRRVLTGREAPLSPASRILDLMPSDQLHGLILSPPTVSEFAQPLVAALASAKDETAALREKAAALKERNQVAAETARMAAESLKAADERLRMTEQRLQTAVERAYSVEEAQGKLADVLGSSRRETEDLRAALGRSERLLRASEEHSKRLRSRTEAAEARALAEQSRAADALARTEDLVVRARAAELGEQAAVAAAELAAARAAKAETRATMAEAEAHAIRASTSWHLTLPLRAAMRHLSPATRHSGRRVLKAVWRLSTGRPPGDGTTIRALRLRLLGQHRSGDAVSAPATGLIEHVPVRPQSAAGEPALRPRTDASAERSGQAADGEGAYQAWREAHRIRSDLLAFQARFAAGLSRQPLFSVLVPIYRTPPDVFLEMVRSVLSQTYGNWELCLAAVDKGQADALLMSAARDAAAQETRVQLEVLQTNNGIAGNSNVCLNMARGDWIVLLDHDDMLSPDALFQLARAINSDPSADFIYSDKDMVDRSGTRHYAPLFKPGWSPDTMLNANMLTHVCTMRTDRVREIGGWDQETDGAQDWDLFLRVIGSSGRVVHVPHVLYHWRHIETSVAASGFDAKPFAAAGQLRAMAKHLPVAGWADATPRFEGPYLRIEWGGRPGECVSVVICGDVQPEGLAEPSSDLIVEVLSASGADMAHAVDVAIHRAQGSVIVLVDAGFLPDTPDWVEELALPLTNPAIAAVAGRVLDHRGMILDYGVYLQDGVAFPAFRGEPEHYSGPAGGAGWYRNFSAAAGGALAFRRRDWEEVGGLSAYSGCGRPDIAFTLDLRRRGFGRILVNPFARFRATVATCSFERDTPLLAREAGLVLCPDGDPYLNRHLDAAVSIGAPAIRVPQPQSRLPVAGHDFALEARYIAQAYDTSAADIAASKAACDVRPPARPRRVIWLLPDFQVAFYGGIFTILRVAEHMRARHGVLTCFAVMTDQTSAAVTRIIREAIPALADSAEVVTFLSPAGPPDLGEADAAICTLWITAYPLLALRGVGRKYYFMQDWEPSFYPGGTISAMVEATYRFGFHAICNTPALAHSYSALGGEADHFLPAIDSAVFHGRGRRARAGDEPFVLVCYARPNAPRNCFEVMSQGLIELKRRYGESILILSAGAQWEPSQYGLEGVVENLGLLPYAETGALYRAADAGFVAMATRHPSYLPFELMACGAAVVSNRNPFTSWLLRDEANSLLCEMTRSDIATTVGRLLEDPALRDRLAMQAMDDVERNYGDWTTACERVYEVVAAK